MTPPSRFSVGRLLLAPSNASRVGSLHFSGNRRPLPVHSAAKHKSVSSLSSGKSSARTCHRWAISQKVRTRSARFALTRPLRLPSPEAAHYPFAGRQKGWAREEFLF